MTRFTQCLVAAVLTITILGDASAQVVTYYQPATTYYAAPTYTVARPLITTPAPAVVAAPAPTVTYYAPQVAAPIPTVAYYAPPAPAPVAVPVAAPAPVVTYYRAPTVTYQPVNRVITRYRPFLGGTVTYVRPTYVPVTTY